MCGLDTFVTGTDMLGARVRDSQLGDVAVSMCKNAAAPLLQELLALVGIHADTFPFPSHAMLYGHNCLS